MWPHSHRLKQFMAAWAKRPSGRMGLKAAVRLVAPKHRIGVNAVCLDPQGRVLLLKHVYHPTAPWGLPGGWLDKNEHPAAAAVRELREETGLHGRVERPLIIERDLNISHVGIIYLVALQPDSPPPTLSHEILAADWFTPQNLPRPLTAVTYRALDAALHQKVPRPAVVPAAAL